MFVTSEQPKRYNLWTYQKAYGAFQYLLDAIFIRVGTKLYRQMVGFQMGANCAPVLFCYERDFMFIVVSF